MRPLQDLVRKNVIRLKPFSSARAEFEGTADVLLDANENPFNTGYNRYPDPYQKSLKDEIGKWRKVSANNVFLGNGSDEIIDLLVRTFCEPKTDRIRYIYPSFGMYEVVADVNDVEKLPIHLLTDFQLDKEACYLSQERADKLLFLCSPNNPTGNSYQREDLLSITEAFEGIVVVDEAYIDFSTQASLISDLDDYPNLVILQTFSKALGAAGLRIGMAFASEDIIRYLNKIKPPYNIGTETQKIALDILKDIPKRDSECQLLITERGRIQDELTDLSVVKHIFPSDANFLLIRFDEPLDVLKYLVDKNIVVRNRSTLPGCEGCLRMTIGTIEENNRLISALKAYES